MSTPAGNPAEPATLLATGSTPEVSQPVVSPVSASPLSNSSLPSEAALALTVSAKVQTAANDRSSAWTETRTPIADR
jgi:hypothetical protein